MLIYVEKITNRIRYALGFIFELENIPFEITDNYGRFLSNQGNRFNYSKVEIENVPQIIPASLILEARISEQTLGLAKFKDEDCLTFDRQLDPIAAVFFVLSRYEEYLDSERDSHNRFSAKKSINYKNKWLNKLVCDRWSESIISFIFEGNGADFTFSKKEVLIVPTFDIDNAFAFQNKSAIRRFLSFSKDSISFNFKRIQQRRKVIKKLSKDPYDTYDIIKEISKKHSVYIFWLLGNFSKYDKNIPYQNFQQQKLIRKLSGFSKIGIHPSYQSNTKSELLEVEMIRLSQILNAEISHSRQHFLKLSLPETYQHLIKFGIQHDFTMGYADLPGFRSGTVRPHNWFDLYSNEVSSLMIHPFTYMDGTLNEYMMLTIEEAKEIIDALYKEIKLFGGEFSFIWHNETINNLGKWKGWSEVLDFSLNLKNHE
jgi:hypothetical protein